MAEESGAEKTEDPTARKLRNARDEGQVARSAELPAAAVTIGAILASRADLVYGARKFLPAQNLVITQSVVRSNV